MKSLGRQPLTEAWGWEETSCEWLGLGSAIAKQYHMTLYFRTASLSDGNFGPNTVVTMRSTYTHFLAHMRNYSSRSNLKLPE